MARKRVLVVDDSTIRGTNASHGKNLLVRCNVKNVYYANYTPKIGVVGEDGIGRGCMFGVDMPPSDNFIVRTSDKLSNRAAEEINRALGMQVYYLSKDGMFNAFERAGIKQENLCSYCLGGKHPFK